MLFGVCVETCPYGYIAEWRNCVLDASLDRYAPKDKILAQIAPYSFEGSAQLRKKNHQFVQADSNNTLARSCPSEYVLTPDQRCVRPAQAAHLLDSGFVLEDGVYKIACS